MTHSKELIDNLESFLQGIHKLVTKSKTLASTWVEFQIILLACKEKKDECKKN
jgi:hypothetical protein